MSGFPAWQPIVTAHRDRTTPILVCGGTFVDDCDWNGTAYPFTGVAIVSFHDGYNPDEHRWRGEPNHSHDEFRYHSPTHWMSLPKPIATCAEQFLATKL